MSSMSAPTPPMESFFSPLSLLPNAPSSMSVPSMMNASLSVGRLYRSSTFMKCDSACCMQCMWWLVRPPSA
ncbi:hypothetical protein ZOSMA_40G00590 [Zostera marina]|uniref:Uncharacterized protein n=1 Tax=Zostera marina TaxID=29655 RepID=A0A0K9P367_ZOSMR|nr:hypothetical protein ZOSMA_40G00590 [Zostera marina]